MSIKRIALAAAAAAVLAAQGLSAQAVFIPAKIQKEKAAQVAARVAEVPPLWSAGVEESVKALVALARADGSLAFVNAAIVEKARAGEASLPELLFLLVSGAYGPMEMDIARGALAIAAREAGLEAAAALYLVQLLQDNYGMAIAYRMPTLESHGIRTIEDLKARWADVQRLLADGEDAKRWIARLVAAEEYEFALKMLDLAAKGRLVDAGYEKMMRAGIARLAEAARKGSRKLALVLGPEDMLNTMESWQYMAPGPVFHAIGFWRSEAGDVLVVNGKEYGPGERVSILKSEGGGDWVAFLSGGDSGGVAVDSRGGVRTGVSFAARAFYPVGDGAVAIEDRATDTVGRLDLGDGRSLAYRGEGALRVDFGSRNYSGSKTYREAAGGIEVEVGDAYFGPFAETDYVEVEGDQASLWGKRADGTQWVVAGGKLLGPFERASSPRYHQGVQYYATVQEGWTSLTVGGKTIGPYDADPGLSIELAFSPDGSRWTAAIPFAADSWVLIDQGGAALPSRGKPYVAYRADGSRLAATAGEDGYAAVADSASGSEVAVKGRRVAELWTAAEGADWWAMVEDGPYARLIDSAGADLGLYAAAAAPVQEAMAAAGLTYLQETEDSPIVILKSDGSELVRASWISNFTVSPGGGAWGLVYGDEDWNSALLLSDGTKKTAYGGLSVAFASDTEWWMQVGEELVSSSGETIANVIEPVIDAERRTLSWFEMQDDKVYAVSRKF